MSYLRTIQNNPKAVNIFLTAFYTIGLTGILIEASSSVFISLTPVALILSFCLLMLFHNKPGINSIVTFLLIAILGFIIEERGVNTGLIFGSYNYGETLGLKLNNTPLIIGLNWLLMTYITSSVFEHFRMHNIFKVVGAAALMVIYDLVLEQVAPLMNMWSWKNDIIPVQNYLAWFVIAVIFQTLLKVRKIDTRNPVGIPVLLIQFVFFISLFFILR